MKPKTTSMPVKQSRGSSTENSKRIQREIFRRKRQFFDGILCVFREKITHFRRKRSDEARSRFPWSYPKRKKDAPQKAVRLMNLSSANLLPYQPFREPTIMPLVKYFRMKG